MKRDNKSRTARDIGVSRQLLYYRHKQRAKDWKLKTEIEEVLHEHPSYGHKRLAICLKINKKRVLRVMKLYGLSPYRKRGKKFKYNKATRDLAFPNLLLNNTPEYPNHIWASDFTHIAYQGKWLYLATILDLYTRKIVGYSVLTSHGNELIINALFSATHNNSPARILHSDHGSEYASYDYASICHSLGIRQSMSRPGCPWENGYQESFYNQFKIDLGDPDRFSALGELVYNIYRTIHRYNNERIHSKLKCRLYCTAGNINRPMDNVSKEMGTCQASFYRRAKYEAKLKLQCLIFPEKPVFDFSENRTPKLSLILQTKRELAQASSPIVVPRGIEPLLTG